MPIKGPATNPEEEVLRNWRSEKAANIRRKMQEAGKPLIVPSAQLNKYLHVEGLPEPSPAEFMDIKEPVIAVMTPQKFGELAIIEEAKSLQRAIVTHLRSYYLVRQLIHPGENRGLVECRDNLMHNVVTQAGELGLELPDPWTEMLPREQIRDLLREGREQMIIRSRKFDLHRSLLDGRKLMNYLNHYKTPLDCIDECLSIAELLELEKAQNEFN